MMLACPKHGHQLATMMSADLAAKFNSGVRPDFRILSYEDGGEVVLTFYLSKEFSASHDINEFGLFPLPEDYPAWIHELFPVCNLCIAAAVP
jgi:hypothetical protein